MYHKRLLIRSLLVLGIVLSLSGCSIATSIGTVTYEENKRSIKPDKDLSERVRELSEDSTSESEGEIEDDTSMKYSKADLKLYNSLIKDEANITFSPYSLRNCIGIIYNGCNDEVKEMLDTEFGFESRGTDYYNEYEKSVSMGDDYGVAIANKAYIRDEKELKLDLLNTNDIEKMDMRNAVKACEIMNKYISDNTKEKIQNLIKPENITPSTSLVAINCLYFKQKWTQDEKEVNWKQSGYIKAFGDTSKDLAMVKEVDGLDILRLKYDDCNYSMYIICDNEESTTKNVDSYLSNISIEDYMNILEFEGYEGLKDYDEVYYVVPEFKMENQVSLIKYFVDNEYEDLLSSIALNKLGDIRISEILQGTFIDVNKEGTEAAASTAIISKCNSVLIEDNIKTKNVIVDDTFHFVIKDDITGEILFMGRVDNVE